MQSSTFSSTKHFFFLYRFFYVLIFTCEMIFKENWFYRSKKKKKTVENMFSHFRLELMKSFSVEAFIYILLYFHQLFLYNSNKEFYFILFLFLYKMHFGGGGGDRWDTLLNGAMRQSGAVIPNAGHIFHPPHKENFNF